MIMNKYLKFIGAHCADVHCLNHEIDILLNKTNNHIAVVWQQLERDIRRCMFCIMACYMQTLSDGWGTNYVELVEFGQ